MNLFYNIVDTFGPFNVLTMSHRHDRQAHIIKQLVGIGKGDDRMTSIKFHYSTTWPYNDFIVDAVNKANIGRFTKSNEYDCTRNHYSIVKQAYDRGDEYVLIIEDDIKFLKRFDIFNTFISNVPDDFDILQLGGFTTDPNIMNETYSIEDYDKGVKDYWYHNESIGLWNCSMYILSRRGMEYYINFINKILWVADGPLFKAPLNKKIIKIYNPRIPLVIQEDKNKMLSDIRDKTNDKIDYLADNMFEKKIKYDDYL